MIPKIIHYCWFGNGDMPQLAVDCINSWKKYCPDYEIIRWDENNFDLECNAYVKEAYAAKRWAFVSDYARLWIVYNYGGIYLDVDVEIIKPLNSLLGCKWFLGTETTGFINTGLGFGAEKGNSIILEMLREYEGRHYLGTNGVYDVTPCPARNTKPLVKMGFTYSSENAWSIAGGEVYPPDYFCPMDYETGKLLITSRTFSIHHFSALWVNEDDRKSAEEIQKIIEGNEWLIIKHLKKQYILFKRQKKEGNTKCFVSYLLAKVIFKIYK